MSGRNGIVNAMSVDVEDYYQVSAFAGSVERAKWNSFPSRVEDSTRRTLDMFAEAGVRATFFTLGCVAERHKGLVRAIADAGMKWRAMAGSITGSATRRQRNSAPM